MRRRRALLLFSAALAACLPALAAAAAKCGCSLALASYYLSSGQNLTMDSVGALFGVRSKDILPYNPSLKSADVIFAASRLSVPFPSCDCLRLPSGVAGAGGYYAAHSFSYTVKEGESYTSIASTRYANLTTDDWLTRVNSYSPTGIPNGVPINVTINCSCGDPGVDKGYGLFETYPLRPEDNLSSVAGLIGLHDNGSAEDLLTRFNPGVNFSAGTGIVFFPVKDLSGSYRPLASKSKGLSGGVIAGISVGVVVVLLALAAYLYFGLFRKKFKNAPLLPSSATEGSVLQDFGTPSILDKTSSSTPQESTSPLLNFTVDKSVEFSYEELAKATDDFSMTNKIGGGGFGDVYYAELRGEKAAIKKMDMQATREFLAELKVLTHVHHLNLVRLIGYCVEGSLFLVYEFIENGNLSEHLRGTGRDPLPWSARVQIALDSARGLEYIHEHTVPVYIHRDIKSANILIDKNFHAKVADFGLAKLTEVGSSSLQTRLVGTFGYMPPEYAQYGEVSPKVDVYAYGVVLFELISAKEAIVKTGSTAETRGLVAMFEDALSQPDTRVELRKIVDRRLEDSYSIDAVHKMAQLAKACTQENSQLRPSMRSIVVALMTLSSSTEDWDVGSFYENQALMNLMSGR